MKMKNPIGNNGMTNNIFDDAVETALERYAQATSGLIATEII